MLPFKGARGRLRVGCSWSAPPASASAAAAPPAIAGSDGRAGRWPQFRCRLGHSLPSPTKALRNSAPGSCHTAPRRSSRIAQTHGDAVPAIRGPSGSGAAHPDHPLRPHLHHGGVVGRGSWADSAREEFGHARMGGMTAPASAVAPWIPADRIAHLPRPAHDARCIAIRTCGCASLPAAAVARGRFRGTRCHLDADASREKFFRQGLSTHAANSV